MAAPILFTNIRIFDGTGAKPYPGEVRVEGQSIAAVAPAPTPLDRSGAAVVDDMASLISRCLLDRGVRVLGS